MSVQFHSQVRINSRRWQPVSERSNQRLGDGADCFGHAAQLRVVILLQRTVPWQIQVRKIDSLLKYVINGKKVRVRNDPDVWRILVGPFR